MFVRRASQHILTVRVKFFLRVDSTQELVLRKIAFPQRNMILRNTFIGKNPKIRWNSS
jgi:hypothetical protein